MINFVENLRKIQGAQNDSRPTSTINTTINNISNSLPTTNTLFEAKLINITTKISTVMV